MKKLIISTLLTAASIAGIGIASADPMPIMNSQVAIYSQPDFHSKVIEMIRIKLHVIPIYNQGEWVKVGDASNGRIGWINRQAYRQAYLQAARQAEQPQSITPPPVHVVHKPVPPRHNKPVVITTNDKSIFISITPSKNGGQAQITAYVNGKPLNPRQSKKLLRKLQQKQKNMAFQEQRLENQLEANFHHFFNQFNMSNDQQ